MVLSNLEQVHPCRTICAWNAKYTTLDREFPFGSSLFLLWDLCWRFKIDITWFTSSVLKWVTF